MSMMARLVPDASAILKWVLPVDHEPYAVQARTLRDHYINGECELIVPALWLFEIGNIVTRRYPDHARDILDALCALEMTVYQSDAAWRAHTVRIASRYGATFYDASYHAVAIASEGVLVSADEKYLRRAQGAGRCCFIGDWQPA